MSVWSVAAAQSGSRPGDVEWNILHHLDFINQAAEQHVELIIFPELSITGYELALASELAMNIDDPRLDVLAEAAVKHKMGIVTGLPLRYEDEIRLSAITFLPDGTRLAYCKQNLVGDERLFFKAGQGVPLFGYQHHHVALAICADINIEEYARDAAQRGASLYASSVLFSENGYQKDCDRLARWAGKYNMAVIMANHALPTGGYQSAGKSAFWNEAGEQIIQSGSGEQLLIVRRTGNDWQGEVHSLRWPLVY